MNAAAQRRWVSAVLLTAVALTVSVACGESGRGSPTSTPTGTPPSQSSSPTAAPSPSAPTAPDRFGYQPLWPFESVAAADVWQRAYRDGGHQPWHLDAETTALSFTQQYLGYANVDAVVDTSVRDEQAWVSVGFDNPNGDSVTAAVVHLARIGTGSDAPWEVVGTDDSTLTVTEPGYGTTVKSPVTVSGVLSGVDESLRLRVLRSDQQLPIGERAGIPAGGANAPWTASIPFSTSCPAVLTVAVATGGHVAEVERFAVTGVRC
ncbi:hypothetical protein [Nocardia sp. NPDC049149]|uniref:hypothetical protein n=1 Tax=Nocardia sp. NPDC049149 TaxID=3364315 RepID=UPI0037106641